MARGREAATMFLSCWEIRDGPEVMFFVMSLLTHPLTCGHSQWPELLLHLFLHLPSVLGPVCMQLHNKGDQSLLENIRSSKLEA